jgi:hypothetical protein
MKTIPDLTKKHCTPSEKGDKALTTSEQKKCSSRPVKYISPMRAVATERDVN